MKSFLAEFFDCGENDLYILDEFDGDVLDFADVVDLMRETDMHTLNDVIYSVFNQVIVQLQTALDDKRDEILEDLETFIDEEKQMLMDGGCSTEEIIGYTADTDDPLGQACADLLLLQTDALHPCEASDHSFYCNMSDSSISLAHLDWYRRNMSDVIDELEGAMQFSFVDY